MYKKILVALDTTDEARPVMQRALEMASRFDAQLALIHVVEPMLLDNSYESLPLISVDVEKALYERARGFLAHISEEFGLREPKILVEVGSVKTEILRQVEQQDIDLLVIGTHGRHGVALLLGSTANAILHGTRCDVLAVRI